MVDTCQVWQHLSMDIDHEIFSMVILSLSLTRRAVISFWQKNVHRYELPA